MANKEYDSNKFESLKNNTARLNKTIQSANQLKDDSLDMMGANSTSDNPTDAADNIMNGLEKGAKKAGRIGKTKLNQLRKKRAEKKALEKGTKEAGKQAGKQASKEAGKAAIKSGLAGLKAALGKLLVAAAPYILPILGILIAIIIAIVLLLLLFNSNDDNSSASQNLTKSATNSNTTALNKEGLLVTDSFTFQNKMLYTYYQYWSEKSLYIYIEDDEMLKENKLEGPLQFGSSEYQSLSNFYNDSTGTPLKDKWEREKYFYVSPESLFVLDKYLNKQEFIYPQQFIQPVPFDLKSFKLKKITDDEGKLTIKSIQYSYSDSNKMLNSHPEYKGFESYGKLREDGSLDFSFSQYASADAVGGSYGNSGSTGGGAGGGQTASMEDLKKLWPSNMESWRNDLLKFGGDLVGVVDYVWGGGHGNFDATLENPSSTGVDCSGFVSYCYAKAGMNFGSQSTQYWNNSTPSNWQEISQDTLVPGDVGVNGHHVGIYVGKDSSGTNFWMHSPQTGEKVKISAYSTFTKFLKYTGTSSGVSGGSNPTLSSNELKWPTDSTDYKIVLNHASINASSGANVYACQDGTVDAIGYDLFLGNYIIINHGNDYVSIYTNLASVNTSKDSEVKKGTTIAISNGTLGFYIKSVGIYMTPDTYKYDKDLGVTPKEDAFSQNKKNTLNTGTVLWTKDRQNGYKTTIGVWDYGFGSILKYNRFIEEAENRGNLTHVKQWNPNVSTSSGDTRTYGAWDDTVYSASEAKANVSKGYQYDNGSHFGDDWKRRDPTQDKTSFVIKDVITPAGTITNKIEAKYERSDDKFGPGSDNGISELDSTEGSSFKATSYTYKNESKSFNYVLAYDEEIIYEKIKTIGNDKPAIGDKYKVTTKKSNYRIVWMEYWDVTNNTNLSKGDKNGKTDIYNSVTDLNGKKDERGESKYDNPNISKPNGTTTSNTITLLFKPNNSFKTKTESLSISDSVLTMEKIETSEKPRYYASGYVWRKIPRYKGDPDMSDMDGVDYYYDYFKNYTTYAPTKGLTENSLVDNTVNYSLTDKDTEREKNTSRLSSKFPDLYEIVKTEKFDPDEILKKKEDTNNGLVLEGNTIEEQVWNGLKSSSLNLSDEQVAAVMSNIQKESGFDPATIEGGNGIGFGLIQWSYGRRTQLEQYASSIGKSASDIAVQIEFLVAEMTEGGGCNGFANFGFMSVGSKNGRNWGQNDFFTTYKNDLQGASEAFMWCFERPNAYYAVQRLPSQLEYAQAYYDKYHGTTPSGGGSSGSSSEPTSIILDDVSKEIMRNIIYAVETGGQVYGNKRYDDFTEAGANTENEKAITIGAGQWYATEAKNLLDNIYEKDPSMFTSIDKSGKLKKDLDSKDWSTYTLSKDSEIAKIIQQIISSDAGKKCQDKLIDEQMQTYVDFAVKHGVTDVAAAMFCANFQHQGGEGAVTRILGKTTKPYTLENLYASIQSDTGNQVGAYKERQTFVFNKLKECRDAGQLKGGEVNGGDSGDTNNDGIYTLYDWCQNNWSTLKQNIRVLFPALKYFTYNVNDSEMFSNDNAVIPINKFKIPKLKTNNCKTILYRMLAYSDGLTASSYNDINDDFFKERYYDIFRNVSGSSWTGEKADPSDKSPLFLNKYFEAKDGGSKPTYSYIIKGATITEPFDALFNTLIRNEKLVCTSAPGAEIYSPAHNGKVTIIYDNPIKKEVEVIIEYKDTCKLKLYGFDINTLKVKEGDIVNEGDIIGNLTSDAEAKLSVILMRNGKAEDPSWLIGSGNGNSSGSGTSQGGTMPTIGPKVPCYKQYNESWSGNAFGTSTIADAGCGVCTSAMIVSYLTGNAVDPGVLVEEAFGGANAVSGGYYVPGVGINQWKAFPRVAEVYGLQYSPINNSEFAIRQALTEGKIVALSVSHTPVYKGDGHVICVRGIGPNGGFLINDSNTTMGQVYELDKEYPFSDLGNPYNIFAFWK